CEHPAADGGRRVGAEGPTAERPPPGGTPRHRQPGGGARPDPELAPALPHGGAGRPRRTGGRGGPPGPGDEPTLPRVAGGDPRRGALLAGNPGGAAAPVKTRPLA